MAQIKRPNQEGSCCKEPHQQTSPKLLKQPYGSLRHYLAASANFGKGFGCRALHALDYRFFVGSGLHLFGWASPKTSCSSASGSPSLQKEILESVSPKASLEVLWMISHAQGTVLLVSYVAMQPSLSSAQALQIVGCAAAAEICTLFSQEEDSAIFFCQQ